MQNELENIDIEKTLQNFKKSLPNKVNLASLYEHSKKAHKWKVTYILLMLREAILWRTVDIISQAHYLSINKMIIGSRILIRSALETICMLIYMNKKIQSVVEGNMSFEDFNKIIERMYIGAKNENKILDSINVMKFIKESEIKYPGIKKIYNDLCETAHPNYFGVSAAYTKRNIKRLETDFGIFWKELYSDQHERGIKICLSILFKEYNEEWVKQFMQLEKWLEKNESDLEKRMRKSKIKNP